MTSPIGNPLRIQFNGSRWVGVVLGWVGSEGVFLVHFDFGPSWCFGILWGMDALVPDPSPKIRLANQDGFPQFIRLMDPDLELHVPILLACFLTWTDLLLSCFDIWFALPWISCDILWCHYHRVIWSTTRPKSKRKQLPKTSISRCSGSPWWNTNFSYILRALSAGSASVTWGGGISLPRWNQGMIPWLGIMGMLKAPRSSCCLK